MCHVCHVRQLGEKCFPHMYRIWTGKSVFLYEYVCGISNQSSKCKWKNYTDDCTEWYLKWKKRGCLQVKRRWLVKSVLVALTLVVSQKRNAVPINGQSIWALWCSWTLLVVNVLRHVCSLYIVRNYVLSPRNRHFKSAGLGHLLHCDWWRAKRSWRSGLLCTWSGICFVHQFAITVAVQVMCFQLSTLKFYCLET